MTFADLKLCMIQQLQLTQHVLQINASFVTVLQNNKQTIGSVLLSAFVTKMCENRDADRLAPSSITEQLRMLAEA